MLPSERPTQTIERRIHRAARAILGRRDLHTVYEHGHWWITAPSGEQWDAVDASGGRSVEGFDFEYIGGGDDR